MVVAIVGGVWYFSHKEAIKTGAESSAGAEIDYASDIIGTRVGTSTVGAHFEATSATTTYRIRTGGASTAIFTLLATNASSTGNAGATFNFLGSNDWDCATASTTTGILNPILTTDINWYDIGYNVVELAGSQALGATSTIHWTPTTGLGKTLTLTSLNYECIRIDVSASSTEMLMQARLKK